MSPRELSNRRIQEVREAMPGYVPRVPGTDKELLTRLCASVLSSVDVRDLRTIETSALIEQLEYVLDTIRQRRSGEIRTKVHAIEEGLVVLSCIEDQPFVVSALRALFASEGLEVRGSLNAVIRLRRDRDGVLQDFGSGTRESIVRMEVRLGDSPMPANLVEKVAIRLDCARAMVRDFDPMKQALRSDAGDLLAASERIEGEASVALRETEGLLRWLCEENYVLFSVEEYGADGQASSIPLGAATVAAPARETRALARCAAGEDRLVRYHRSAQESPVHRAGKPGHFIITRVDRRGKPCGSRVVDGLFTYKALHTPPEEIPFLRMILRDMLNDRGVSVDSHRGKSITNAFNSLPLEYLLAESRASVWELTDRVLRAEEEGESDVHIQIGEDRRSAFVFVALPREQFSEDLRLELQEALLDDFHASYTDYGVYIDRYENAIIHFYITGASVFPEVDTEKLRARVHELAKGWHERLREALVAFSRQSGAGASETERLFEIYVDAFNEEHRRRAAGERLVGDIRCLERIRGGSKLEAEFFVSRSSDHPGSLSLRVISSEALRLSRQLPVIGSFGLEVIDEYTREVRLAHRKTIEMHTFRLDVRSEQHSRLLTRAHDLEEGIREVFAGRRGRDKLNRLVADTSLTSAEVEILRAYVAYLHQLRSPFDVQLIRQVMVDHPAASQALVNVLGARFDPAQAHDPEAPKAAVNHLQAELAAITDYTADRVLKAIAEPVLATVRTNCFVVDGSGEEAMAFKIDGTKISFGPSPKPFREIWVYSSEVEGVHLRGGLVARGGLRFSDRPDDFRTEIHGLMATQKVKNVLIVPMGAKGGFVLRNPPAGRAELRAAGDRYYEVFIRALLSVSDNVVEGEVVTPPGIRHEEGPDPYLVVAADKGTAHLSDTANAISMERKFWLDDAFASGGSNGYDHKATGITARGAWETTKRSFRELGIDPECDLISAIGVGDMSGDVFGNGLLRSKTIELRAAFNHMHIFLDPTPDAGKSFVERKRLFNSPGSTWADYDSAVLSKGGGVWSRNSKEVPLPPECRTLLGIDEGDVLSGDDVIRLIMKMNVDLFWMGGIGTYIKSREETDAEVGDKANDSVRINAHELHCRVFAEGANLSITDRGRSVLAKRGGENYTAFLDNSGGVDVSDHEVNIKILFAPLLAKGSVSRAQRNVLLEQVEDEVCEMVLDNNRSQSRMVSYDVRQSRGDLWKYSRTLRTLASDVPFDPEAFSMPTEDELGNRFRRREGMAKCEAAVLGSHAKMLAYSELLAASPLPRALEDRLVESYFPARIRVGAGEAVHKHLLHREIATTMLVNKVVDSAGASFFSEMVATTGRTTRDVAVAYMSVVDFGEVDDLLTEIYALEDKNRQEVVYQAMAEIQGGLADATFYLLGPVSAGVLDLHGDAEQGRALLRDVVGCLPAKTRRALDAKSESLVAAGLPEGVVERMGRLAFLPVVLDALLLAKATGRGANEMLRLRLQVDGAMNLPALKAALGRMHFASPWDGPAVLSLGRQLELHVHKMTRLVDGDDVEAMLSKHGLDRVRQQIHQFLEAEVSIAALVMLDGQLRRLLPAATTVTGPA